MEIVLATRNSKKLVELRRILDGLDVTLHTLDEFPGCPEVEENMDTFDGNAIKKARAITNCTGMPALSDDSGLEVEALGGAPGVFSARYAGEGADDQANVAKLLDAMKGLPAERRHARFVCAIALADPGGSVEVFRGTVSGVLGTAPIGENGFGYDPVFYPEGNAETFAQMGPEGKDSMSHRSRALGMLRTYLASILNNK